MILETIAEYADGEKTDVLINLDNVQYIRPHHEIPDCCVIEWHGDEGGSLKIFEPFASIRARLLQTQAPAR